MAKTGKRRINTYLLLLDLCLALTSSVLLNAPSVISPAVAQESSEGEQAAEADRLLQQGIQQYDVGQWQAALQSWQAALEIYRDLGDRSGEISCLGNLGTIQSILGNYQQAIGFYQQALELAQELESLELEAKTLNNLGLAHFSLGQYERAIQFYQQALAIKQQIDGDQGEANSLGNLGLAYFYLGRYQQAIEFHQQALAIERDTGARRGEVESLSNIGMAYHALGQYLQAIEVYQQALEIAQEINYIRLQIKTLNNIGSAYDQLEQYQQAVEVYYQSLEIAQQTDDRVEQGRILTGLGDSYFSLEMLPEAEKHLFDAIEIWESLRPDLTDTNRISLFETQLGTYNILQRTLVASNSNDRALEVAERGRAQAFAALLMTSMNGSVPQIDNQLLSFNRIQQLAARNEAVFVEYSLVSDTELYIWVIQPTGEMALRQVNFDSNQIDLTSLISQSREYIGVRSRGGFELSENSSALQDEQLRKLHQLLIAPIADLLPSRSEERVIFIPHDELFLVPFPALKDASGQYLIENHTISTIPAIQILDLTQQRHIGRTRSPSNQEFLIVGNPDMPKIQLSPQEPLNSLSNLPGAEREALAISEFFNTQALIGERATELLVKQHMLTARVVHLATHGLLEYGTSEDSAIQDVPGAVALASGGGEDGLLTSREILDLDLNAELIVLSACDTGLGEVTGDGVNGLSRSLIAAGALSVIVSLWSVPDAPTAEFMAEFYRQWQRGQDKAQALRQAMLITMEKHPNPQDWAAFALIGEAE
ncbi:CHAT domain-containing protein [Leptolyngbya sp. FACHB-541]|uniref:CHAT domain-containing protein n=1 Tax=Leptolyngbya sp. FACHB-541 TaxID=2692810 RepID=UPI00168A3517|nr:CHAT domain-containing tetratricopeptide repeat protein [Leptolyngbya sp. FACHB-541]MBD2001427.1 CHAT domain-containing protein [Leptolyngbya sp. FACHB-541]